MCYTSRLMVNKYLRCSSGVWGGKNVIYYICGVLKLKLVYELLINNIEYCVMLVCYSCTKHRRILRLEFRSTFISSYLYAFSFTKLELL